MLPNTDDATGVEGVANNARVITENRFIFSEIGNESGVCKDGSSTTSPTVEPTTITTAITSQPSSSSCGNCVFPFKITMKNRKTVHDSCTTIDGAETPWCSTKVDENGDHIPGPGHVEDCKDPRCPGVSTAGIEMEVAPGNEVGSCCKSHTLTIYLHIMY